MEEEEALPDHLRCKRTDGKQWRCRGRVIDGKNLCQIHYIQSRHRLNKEAVPESLKLKRRKRRPSNQESASKEMGNEESGAQNQETRAKKGKKRANVGVSEDLDGSLKKLKLKRDGLQLELIRECLKREMEKKKERELRKNSEGEAELTKQLPNGVMAISTALPQQNLGASPFCDVKLGTNSGSGSGSSLQRCFRSKNIEPIPISTMQMVPYAQDVAKLRKKKRKINAALGANPSYSAALPQQDLGANPPCNVKLGSDSGSDSVPRRRFRSKNSEPIPSSAMQIVPYVENEANLRKRKRKKCHWCRRSNYRILIKCSTCKKEYFCTECIKERPSVMEEQVKTACPVCCRTCNCSACLENQSKDDEDKVLLQDPIGNEKRVEKIQQLRYLIYALLPVLKQINRQQSAELELEAKIKGKILSEFQIQQAELGGNKLQYCNNCRISVVDFHRRCGNCSYNLCLRCSEFFRQSLPGREKAFIAKCPNKYKACLSGDKVVSMMKHTSIFRQDSGSCYFPSPATLPKWKACNDDGSIICPPTAYGGCGDGPLDLKCIFPFGWTRELEKSAEQIVGTYDSQESFDASSRCSWCRGVGNKDSESNLLKGAASREDSNDNFLYYPSVQDLRDKNLEHFQKHWGKGHPVIVHRVLESTVDLSWDPIVMLCTYLEKCSTRSKNGKEAIEAIDCLDWCEIEICSKQIFMGFLEGQSQANMQYEMLKLKVWLSSYLFQEQFPDHHAEIIRALPLQEYLNPVSSPFNLAVNLPQNTAKLDLGPCVQISFGSPEDFMQADFVTKLCCDAHDMVDILVHTTEVSISPEQLTKIKNLMKKCNAQDQRDPTSITTDQKTDNELEKSSVLIHNTEASGLQDLIEDRLPLPNALAEVTLPVADFPGAQWDVFRRQDAPKLLEYLSTHFNDFRRAYCSPKQVGDPILDQKFYLDATHKMRLKQEFNIEPWTFEQHLGEAVIIPAGCPYQIRKLKSCVNVILDFVSPENATECINLIEELHLLPVHHRARKNMLEVKKLALLGICTAVKEIHNLTEADMSSVDRGLNNEAEGIDEMDDSRAEGAEDLTKEAEERAQNLADGQEDIAFLNNRRNQSRTRRLPSRLLD